MKKKLPPDLKEGRQLQHWRNLSQPNPETPLPSHYLDKGLSSLYS